MNAWIVPAIPRPGLAGDEISSFGQITAIVDIYDALTAERSYKRSMLPTLAMERLVEWSRFYLNQDLVDQFIAHLGVYPVGTLVRLSSGIVGVVTQQGERGFSHPVIRAIYDMAKNKWLSRIEINLSKKADRGETDEIVSCESPNRYAVDPAALLGSETIFSHRGADDF